MGMILSKSAMGRAIGINRKVIDDWISEGLETELDGRNVNIDMSEVVAFLKNKYSGADIRLKLAEAQARLTEEKADSEEMSNAVKRGDLVSIEQAGDEWAEIASKVSARVQSIATKVAPLVLGMTDRNEIHKIITAECKEALDEISTEIIYTAEEGDQKAKA